MIKSLPPIRFASGEDFEAAYHYVSDAVCLFRPAPGTLVYTNAAFRKKYPDLQGSISMLTVSSSSSEKEEEIVFDVAGKTAMTCLMKVQEARLEEEEVKLGIIINEPAESRTEANGAEAEKKALLNEVYHRVKNNLNIIVSLLSLQINRIKQPEMRLLLLESKSRIFTLSLLQQSLYNSPRISEIKAGTYLQAVANSVLSTFKPKEKSIQLQTRFEESWLNIDTLTPLGLIAHELLSNAILHAFPAREAGKIHLSLEQPELNRFLLRICDDGCGLPTGRAASEYTTLGFQLVRSLSKQLHARMEVESTGGGGTTVSIAFKRTDA